MNGVPKLGLITTGQGPRNEYVAFHRNVLAHLGVKVQIAIKNALDGLTRDEIGALESKPGDEYIGCHVHEPGATGDRMGPGWSMVYLPARNLVPLFQKCVDSLDDEGVAATLLICAEEYPVDAFHSRRPLVVPWLVMTDWVKNVTMYMAEPRVGILVPDEEHWAQDLRTWRSQPWAQKVEFVFEKRKGRTAEACAAFRKAKVDMVIPWGYGLGIAPEDAPDITESIEEASAAPFVTNASLLILHLRSLLRPSFDDRRFAGENPVNPPGEAPIGAA